MNEQDFASLVQGVKEMTAHMRGEDVPGLKVTTVPDPDVHAIREAAAVTQKELAERLQVYQKDISRWENNELTPNAITLAKICRELNASADEILELK